MKGNLNKRIRIRISCHIVVIFISYLVTNKYVNYTLFLLLLLKFLFILYCIVKTYGHIIIFLQIFVFAETPISFKIVSEKNF